MRKIKTRLGIQELLTGDRTELDVLLDLVMFTVNEANPKGLDFKGQRSLLRIIQQLESKEDEIELEDADFAFLKGCMERVSTYPVGNSKVVNKFLDIMGV